MKKVLLLLSFLSLVICVFAQKDYKDVVYLKNGSIIRGIIIEQIPNVSIKIETGDKNVFVYKIEEIEKITKESDLKSNSLTNNNTELEPRYCGMLNLWYGFGIGESNSGLSTINFDFINGFQLFPYFSAGIGTGVKIWMMTEESEKPVLIPLFLDLRGNFLKGNISPFIGIDVGYCWEVSPVSQGLGLLFSPTFGASITTGVHSRIYLGTGYSMQNINDADHSVSMWEFNLGFSF